MLVVYTYLKHHVDPDFLDFTYGDCGRRGRRFLKNLSKGSYIFFCRTFGKQRCRYLTGYFKVDKILSGKEVRKKDLISADSKNDEIVIFGDKNKSKKLKCPLVFDKRLAKKFKSINFKFYKLNSGLKSDLNRINVHTRTFPYLSEEDKNMLLKEIEQNRQRIPKDVSISLGLENSDLWGFDEVHKVAEKNEDYVETQLKLNPNLIEKCMRFYDRQTSYSNKKGGLRSDLLFKDNKGRIVIIEIKKINKASEYILNQVEEYYNQLKREGFDNPRKIIFIAKNDMSPELLKQAKEKNVEIFLYGMSLNCIHG